MGPAPDGRPPVGSDNESVGTTLPKSPNSVALNALRSHPPEARPASQILAQNIRPPLTSG